jgi:DNA-directed RNA polymerase specialized sigma24 family protein
MFLDAALRDGCDLLLALAELTDGQRHAVLGRHWRELSFEQLAAERGVTRTAIYMAERGGLEKLRLLLGQARADAA